MITINLEKSLIEENKKLVMPEELLFINEYDKFAPLVENDTLSRVGLNRALKKGQDIKNKMNQNLEETKVFAQDRVFHISQIEGVCKKYRLRFLPTQKYKGVIDKDLANRILTFEIAYNLKCNEHNTKIIAPMESFKLEKKPKDPLMFYEINNEYFYLIHKWGNDLHLSRAILPLFENGLFCWLFIPFLFSILFLISFNIGAYATGISFVVSSLVQLLCLDSEDRAYSFLKPNDWNSEYE